MDPRAELAEAQKTVMVFRDIVEEFADALSLMNDLTSSKPCEVDQRGACREHDHYGMGKVECPHARARRMLNEHAKFWLK